MKSRPRVAALAAVASLGAGCGSPLEPREPESFLRATPIVEHEPPGVELTSPASAEAEPQLVVRTELSPPGERPPPPGAAAAPRMRETRPPKAVIAQANTLASRAPEESGVLNAVTRYAYEPGAFYKIFAAPWRVTDIALEPGEELLGPVAGGDPIRWRLDIGTGAVDGVPQKHLFIKPMRPGLKTNLTLTTNRRRYLLDLESLEETFMVSVEWTYPQDEVQSGYVPAAPESAPARRATAVDHMNFDYKIEVINGSPSWKPRAVYDDGTHTFIRFDRTLLTGEAPSLYVRERGELQVVQYRVKDTLYIVDRLFRVAELRVGNDDNQDAVRLKRLSR